MPDSPSANREKVVVGLSGGVDSSVAAALLVQQGYDVVGLTLWLMAGKGQCCSEGLVDAVRICEQLSIPHQVLDSRVQFERQIVNLLVEGYSRGITPLPCSQCNKGIKFGPMLAYGRQVLGATKVATGHYARVRTSPERHQLLRAVDLTKDQSYFLYDLPQEALGAVLFPLGEYTKAETRELAARFGLATAHKPESQDLCLVESHGSLGAFLERYLSPRPGEIVDIQGKVLGYHQGIHHYTIGQRKGLGVSAPQPLYVVALDPGRNQVVLGERQAALKDGCTVGSVNWVSIAPPHQPLAVQAQIRYQAREVQATLVPSDPDQVQIHFHQPQFGVTPGQAAVWYQEDLLLGGGIIQPGS